MRSSVAPGPASSLDDRGTLRLATFTDDQGIRCGAVLGDHVLDLAAAGAIERHATMCDLLAGGSSTLDRIRRLPDSALRIPLDRVRLEPPVRPAKFMALGLNSRDHRQELTARSLARNLSLIRVALGLKLAYPNSRYPLFFAKATSSIAGPYDEIWSPAHSPTADYEGELCVVIGARCRQLSNEDAEGAIVGYTITNDVSIRGFQLDNPMGPILAKGYETHGPIGPWIVTTDEFDPARAQLRTYVNGRLHQHGNLGELVLSPLRVVSILSRFCTLEPGDLIALGTFAGSGMLERRWLKPGDTVRVEIDGIGHIENAVVPEPAAELARDLR
jgi:2-keto-4-pentenoate hydratase/2-oxohepta-3-ene-1,7-dioic acid hydratase in catechol pathway